jgi:DNA-binding transcriptional MerR regulator
VPARVDESSGYRYYDLSQVPVAQVIRRLRALGMPLKSVRAVVTAPHVAARNELIAAHLACMHEQLAEVSDAVASLQALLERRPGPVTVRSWSVPATEALAISEPVALAALAPWWRLAFSELRAALVRAAVTASGPGGILYAKELFEDGADEVTAFIPVPAGLPATGRAAITQIPMAELAVAIHEGTFRDIDRTYGALGAWVAERELGVEGPIREYHTVTSAEPGQEGAPRTEVGWPVFQTKPVPQQPTK